MTSISKIIFRFKLTPSHWTRLEFHSAGAVVQGRRWVARASYSVRGGWIGQGVLGGKDFGHKSPCKGWTVVKELRHQSEHHQSEQMPTIVVGYYSYQEISSMIDYGVNDYIPKPFKGSDLVARVKNQLRNS